MINTGAMMKTSVDDLTERVEIKYSTKKRDDSGNIIPDVDSSRGTVWAKVLPLSATNGTGYEAAQNTITYRVTMRYRDDIAPDDVIVWRGKTLGLISPAYDAESRRIWVVCDCRELIPDGGQA